MAQQGQYPADYPAEAVGGGARFQGLRFLGKGSHGFVQLALDTLMGQDVAIKYVDRGWSRAFYKYVAREVLNHQSLSCCQHPHIVEFYEVFLTPRYLGVVMEYVPGMNLEQYLEHEGGRLQEDVARFVFQQLIIAVDFCHRKGKVNRDIKLANVMVAVREGQQLPMVKLCDFGFSKDKFEDSQPHSQVGTALFTAPEIFTNTQDTPYDGEAADVWSCGVVLYIMLFGSHPFLSNEDCKLKRHLQVMKLIHNSVSGNLNFPPEAERLQLGAVELLRALLGSKAETRIKIPQILTNNWFSSRLPPGALDLNTQYLAMQVPPSIMRQTPEQIRSIVEAAVTPSGVMVSGLDTPETSMVTSQMPDASVSGGHSGGNMYGQQDATAESRQRRNSRGVMENSALPGAGLPPTTPMSGGAPFPPPLPLHFAVTSTGMMPLTGAASGQQGAGRLSGNGETPQASAGQAALRAGMSRGGSLGTAFGSPSGAGSPTYSAPAGGAMAGTHPLPPHHAAPGTVSLGGGLVAGLPGIPTFGVRSSSQGGSPGGLAAIHGDTMQAASPPLVGTPSSIMAGGEGMSPQFVGRDAPQPSPANGTMWPDPDDLKPVPLHFGGSVAAAFMGADSFGVGGSSQMLMSMLGGSSLMDVRDSLGLNTRGGALDNLLGTSGGTAGLGGPGQYGVPLVSPDQQHRQVGQQQHLASMDMSTDSLGNVLNDSSLLLGMDFRVHD